MKENSYMNCYVYIKNILGVKTNLKSLTWMYGSDAPETSEEEYSKCLVKVLLYIKNDNEVFSVDDLQNPKRQFQYYFSTMETVKIIYTRNFLFGKKLRYSVQIKENEICVIAGRSYMKYVHHRFMNLHSIGNILSDIVCGVLLLNGYATMYCSAVRFEEKNQGIMFFSPPNTGKTLTCIKMCKEYGANFISEDVVLTNGKKIWSIPWTMSYRNTNEKRKFVSKLLDTRKNRSSFIHEMFQLNRITYSSEVTHLIVLEKGASDVCTNLNIIENKIKSLNRYLFYFRKSPTLTVLNYFYPSISIDGMETKEIEIISELIQHTKKFCLSEWQSELYGEAVKRVLNNEYR